MKAEVNEKTLNAMVDAMGAIVRALVATLPTAQQQVFLIRLMDSVESAEKEKDDLLNELLQSLVEIGATERRPEPKP